MSKSAKILFKVLDVIMIFVMTFGSPLSALAGPSPTGATITSDLIDYPPGSTVTLTGAGWAADESVHLFINDDAFQSWNHSAGVIALGDGSFTYQFDLPTWFVANYSVTASGPTSGTATATFTDDNVQKYDQCANDENSTPPGSGYPLSDSDPGCQWINGNLQSNVAYYAEGDATVQRTWLTGLVPGSTHTITYLYQTTKDSGGSVKHAYDFLTTWNWSENWIALDDRCQDITGCTTANETVMGIPDDPNVPNTFEPNDPGDRQFVMRGGTLTSASTPEVATGSYAGSSETKITVSFTVGPNSGSMCSTDNKDVTTCGVALWFGAHVAAQANWGLGFGAGSISGSPYHVALAAQDGSSTTGGGRDNQMQSSVVTQIPNGTIVIVKDAIPDGAQDFNFNLNNNSTISQDFSLDDDADGTLPNSQTFSVPPGTWYATELMPLPTGWTLTNLVCVDPTSNTTTNGALATINLASNETVTCTFTDANAGHIIVEKVTSGGDGSFEFDSSWGNNFFLSNGQTNDSGPLAAGTYSVAELTPPSTWNLTSATCSDGSPINAIALAEGETVTCTFTNTRVYNQDLTVTKTADESFVRTYTWGISKSVDETTANIAEGGSATFNYTVGVTHNNGMDGNFVVSGEITVSNPNAFDIAGVNISDAIEDGGTCSVTNGTNVTVPANGSETRAYSCTFASNPGSGTNTATATWDASAYNTPTATASGNAGYNFAGVTPSIANGSVTVTDPNAPNPPLPAVVSYADPSLTEFKYSKSFSGVGGTCTDYPNTASLSTGASASASVEVCVGKDLTISKIVSASRTRTYNWLIDKSVDDTRIEIAEDGTATFNYSVKVTPAGFTDSAHALGGTITIVNPNDWQDVTLTSLTDTLDTGGTCTITETGPYVVPKKVGGVDGSLTVHYTCSTNGSSTQNNVTATWDKAAYFTPTGSASGSAPVSFTTNEVYKTITVVDDKTDPEHPVTLGTWNHGDGEHTFTYSLDKEGVPGTCTDYTNTAVIAETDQEDSVTVTVCVAKDLTVEKTAVPTFTRTFTWGIDKKVNQTTVNIEEGGTATFNYTVDVTHNNGIDSAWTVTGTIAITNPNDFGSISADVSDAVDNGGTCSLDNAAQATVNVAANSTVNVDYTCTFTDGDSGINTATVTWNGGNDSATGSASFAFTTPTSLVDESVSVSDPLDPNKPRTFSYNDPSPSSFGYSFSTQGVAGECTDYNNTATFTTNDTNTADNDSVTVTVCVGSDLTVSKTAVPTFTRTWNWTITKDTDATYNLFAGESVPHNYLVTVTPTPTDSLWKVTGVITVSNPNDWVVVANVGDVTNVSGVCVVDDSEIEVPANDSVNVGYSCTWASTPSSYTGINTATVIWDKALYFTLNGSASYEKGFEFTNPTEINPIITVTDDKYTPEDPWTANRAYAEWTYTKNFDCSSDPDKYTGDGKYDYLLTNTATINETTGDSDSATVTVNCYAPIVSKTATGTYDERNEWTVTKTVGPVSQSAFIGETVSYEWTVTVGKQTTNQSFKVGGAISVVNPAPMPMTVDLSDTLGGGAVGVIGACTGGTYDAGELTIPANTTAVCAYEAQPGGNTDTVNNVSATLNGIDFNASTTFDWLANVIRGTAMLNDNQNPLLNNLELSAGNTWKYKEDYTCSTDKSLYEGDNTYPFSEDNTATLTFDVGDPKSADATTTVNCYVPTISKTANGTYDEVHDWEVFKSVNTASQTAFAGVKRNFTWTVRVDETTHGENYNVSGVITVFNPNPEDTLTIALNDALNDGSIATITTDADCNYTGGTLTIPAGATATCGYSVAPKGDLNAFAAALPATVTMRLDKAESGDPAYFETTFITVGAPLNGTYEGWSLDTDKDAVNNTPYNANVYSSYETLPAGLLENPDQLDRVNWILNYDFVGKPAGGILGNYTYGDVQRAIWTLIDNTVDTEGIGPFNATRVSNILTAAATNGEGFTPTCNDFVAVVLQPIVEGTNQEVVALAQVSFATLGVPCAATNTASFSLFDVDYAATQPINWSVTQFNPSATLDDDQKTNSNPTFPVSVTGDVTYQYQDPDGYTCSTNPASYTNGFYEETINNTAVLTWSDGSDTALASTKVRCYAPVVTKTAAGAYDERHEWDVEKTVDPTSQNAFAGDTVSYEWTVTVTESVYEENFIASGTISVTNPRPDDGNMIVKLTDVLSDGFVATIIGCTGGTWNATNKTVAVPPHTTADCSYTASLTYNNDANAPTLNTVTANLMIEGQVMLTTQASDEIEWTANPIRASAVIDDDQNTVDFPRTISDGGTWTYEENFTCLTTRTDYGETSFWYDFGEDNTAIVTSGDERDRDSASTEVNCYWPQIELTKTGDTLSKIGDNVNYTITLANNTPDDANLRDLSCTISDATIGFTKNLTLASGASDTSTKAFTIPSSASDPFLNTASVTCKPVTATAPVVGSATFSVGDSSEWSTNLFQPKVEIIKTGLAYATSGTPFTYTFTINNLSSDDSPNLMLDTLSDNVIGNLKPAALAAGCDNLVYNGSCTFDVDYTHTLDNPIQPVTVTNVVTVHYHPAGFPNDITDTDDHTVTVVPKSQLTNTEFCPLANNQFRLLYRLEVAPNQFRLQASNPGQWYYNGFYYGAPGSSFTMTLQIPYPFMTQEGAGNPIQVHDGTALTSGGCYVPTPSLSGFTITTPADMPKSSAGNQIVTPEDYFTKQLGQTTTVTVSGVVPATGLAYVTIHLDYAVKRTGSWKQPTIDLSTPSNTTLNPVNNTMYPDMRNLTGYGNGAVTIHGYEVYNFARTVGSDTSSTAPSSYNELKKFAGFLGLITNKLNGAPMANVKVVIYDPAGKVLATVYTDADGYYMYAYKHTSKSATYTVKVPNYNKSTSVTVKANGFAGIDYEVP